MRRKVKIALVVWLLILLAAAAGHQCGYEQGYDIGYEKAAADAYMTQEQPKEMPVIKVIPPTDGGVKYSMAGAGSDNWSRY